MIKSALNDFSLIIERELKSALTHKETPFDSVYRAMEYSLLAGGKRLRPFIMCEFYKAAGGNDLSSIKFAAALEMIHTYSLIHDDLPCMDNDDFRRGRPSCHKAFNEETALLAGDGLLTLAFETASCTETIPANRVLKAITVLAKCSGCEGMIGGQIIDLECENIPADLTVIEELHRKKTAGLIIAASVIGTILAGGSSEMISAAERYAVNLGLAFQIQDDILDIVGDSAVLGKPVGSDSKNEKSTYVNLVGIEKAKEAVKDYTKKAISSLEVFGGRADTLKELAEYLINRTY